MDSIHKTGKAIGKFVGKVTGEPINYIGKKIDSDYVQEISECVKAASNSTGDLGGRLLNGVASTSIGILKKDEKMKKEGLNDIGTSITQTSKGIYKGLIHTCEDIKDVFQGAVTADHEQLIEGTKGIGKVVAVGALTFSLIDLANGIEYIDNAEAETLIEKDDIPLITNELDEDNQNQPETPASSDLYLLDTRNEGLAGEEHPVTEVQFIEKNIILLDGLNYQGVFPDFDEVYSIQIPQYLYLDSDSMHFSYANHHLGYEIENDSKLYSHFTSTQIEQIKQGQTPDGYVWHHSEDLGRLELVDQNIHEKTAHTGGRELWGGGSNHR